MTNKTTLRIALIASAGAALLLIGLLWKPYMDGGFVGALLALLDTIYFIGLGLTFDQTFSNLKEIVDPGTPQYVLVCLGRFLLPIAVIYALARLIRSRLSSVWAYWVAGHARNHTIVTGSSTSNAFVSSLAASEKVVVLAEPDAPHQSNAVSGKRIYLTRADADKNIWQNLCVAQARRIILADRQAQNFSDLSHIVGLLENSLEFQNSVSTSKPITIHVAITDEAALHALLQSDKALNPIDGCEVRPYSPYLLAARQTMSDYNLHAEARRLGRTRLRALFVGFGPFNAVMFGHFLAMSPAVGFDRPSATILAPDPEAIRARIDGEAPALGAFADVDVALWPASQGGLYRDDLPGLNASDAPLTVVFVDLGTAEENAVQALRLRQLADESDTWHVPILAFCPEAQSIISPTGLACKQLPERVASVGTLGTTCRIDLLDGSRELMARRFHEEYRAQALKAGGSISDPRHWPWERLSETWRNANRRAGDHVPIKLESARHLLAAAGRAYEGNPVAALDETSLTELAKAEHASWAIERALRGWRCGELDNKRKMRPSMIPFDDLPDHEKRKDFDQLRLIASFDNL